MHKKHLNLLFQGHIKIECVQKTPALKRVLQDTLQVWRKWPIQKQKQKHIHTYIQICKQDSVGALKGWGSELRVSKMDYTTVRMC